MTSPRRSTSSMIAARCRYSTTAMHARHHHQEDQDGAHQEARLERAQAAAEAVADPAADHRRSSSQILRSGI